LTVDIVDLYLTPLRAVLGRQAAEQILEKLLALNLERSKTK